MGFARFFFGRDAEGSALLLLFFIAEACFRGFDYYERVLIRGLDYYEEVLSRSLDYYEGMLIRGLDYYEQPAGIYGS